MTHDAGRRASRRVGVGIPVTYVPTGGEQAATEIVQLSAGGCIVSTTDLDPLGPEIFLHFRVTADNVEIHLRARVVHLVEGKGTGLEFVLVSPQDRELLRQHVAERVAQSATGDTNPQ